MEVNCSNDYNHLNRLTNKKKLFLRRGTINSPVPSLVGYAVYLDRRVVAEACEAEDEVGADGGVDVLHVELAGTLAVYGPGAVVAHHHAFRG